MKTSIRIACIVLGAGALAALITTTGFAQDAKAKKDAAPAAAQGDALPPGMTAEDMAACMAAGQPGEMQAWLCEDAGTWNGVTKMWMTPDAEPSTSSATMTATPVLGGRFVETIFKGEMPGAGPFEGRGLLGYDNAAGKFQSTWCDSMGTGIMVGNGELSADKKTLTIHYSYFCPMAKKMCAMRESVTRTSQDEHVMKMWMNDPATGKEFLMMECTYTRTAKGAKAAGR